jgi:RHS repeat-associated protein
MSFSGLAQPFVQTYKYDSLDRIAEAKETVNGSQTWKQTYGYDQYGNRNAFSQIVGSQTLAINNLTMPTVVAATNRFSASQGYSYDKNGNVTTDPASSGRTFIFNGDNKQTEVKNSSNYTIGRYFYDGEGRRVKKVTDLETTVFVYSNGKLIAEYSTATPPSNPTINYTATDQLGSPRIITDKFGQVVSRRDFMPFGEELYADGTNRTAANKYSTSGQDAVRQRFTGYQKDMETGLDFAEARYYNNQHGRFTAVDPLLASGKSANPQTFNRYVYVLNNPLILTDPTGLQAGTDADPIRVNTVECVSAWCKAKSGFNWLWRSIVGESNPYHDEEIADRERKRNGLDKQAGNAVQNSANDLNKVTDAVIDNEPTGIGNVVKATVNNSLGRASDEDVLASYGSAALNTAATFFPAGKAFQIAKAGGRHAGLIVNYASRTDGQILKAINSLEFGKKGLNVHLDKIANPSNYYKNWDKLTKDHQQRVINNWQREVDRFAEEIDVLKGILGER